MQLSSHFSLEEFTASPTAVRLGISNQPDAAHLAALRNTAAQMERVRALLGNRPIHVDSAYRSPALNAAVGGVADSAHMQGHAVDFICPSFGSPYEVAEFLERAFESAGLKYDQLIHEKRIWVHVAFQDDEHGQRGETLTLTTAGEYIAGIHPV